MVGEQIRDRDCLDVDCASDVVESQACVIPMEEKECSQGQ